MLTPYILFDILYPVFVGAKSKICYFGKYEEIFLDVIFYQKLCSRIHLLFSKNNNDSMNDCDNTWNASPEKDEM